MAESEKDQKARVAKARQDAADAAATVEQIRLAGVAADVEAAQRRAAQQKQRQEAAAARRAKKADEK